MAPDAPEAFLENCDGQLDAVEKLVLSATAQAQNEQLTGQIQVHYATLPQLPDCLAARLRRAENLTVPAKNLGSKPTARPATATTTPSWPRS